MNAVEAWYKVLKYLFGKGVRLPLLAVLSIS